MGQPVYLGLAGRVAGDPLGTIMFFLKKNLNLNLLLLANRVTVKTQKKKNKKTLTSFLFFFFFLSPSPGLRFPGLRYGRPRRLCVTLRLPQCPSGPNLHLRQRFWQAQQEPQLELRRHRRHRGHEDARRPIGQSLSLSLHKGLPLGSGLGSSATSAATVAVNEIFGGRLGLEELVLADSRG
jgi:hypothetical protein